MVEVLLLLLIVKGFLFHNGALATKNMEIFTRLRNTMVEKHIFARGITDKRVLESMNTVPRHMFVESSLQHESYNDYPLPIGMGQTISQPYIVAYMIDQAQLKESDKLLEIGTGCGYAAAVAAQLVTSVHTIESIHELGEGAKKRLHDLGYQNVVSVVGDGSLGLPEHAPYDAIIVTAGAPSVPQALKEQLSPRGGRLVIPVRSEGGLGEDLVRVTRRSETEYTTEHLLGVRFVPLVGEQGYPQ